MLSCIIGIHHDRHFDERRLSAARMASSLGAPVAIEAGEVYTLRQSAARHPDHGRSMALGLDCDRPMAIAAGPAIFPERNSAACLVCAGNLGVGRRAAMAGASGTGVRARARTGD